MVRETLKMETVNVFIGDGIFASRLKDYFSQTPTLFGNPKVKLFESREWLMSLRGDFEDRPQYKGEKIDFIFMTAENLKKYYFHPSYKLNLKVVLEKYGKEGTKVIIFRCTSCKECNNFTKSMYEGIITGYENVDFPEKIILKYFEQYTTL